MKICSKCKIEKETSYFSVSKINKDGLDYHCKTCKAENYQKWRSANPDKAIQNKKLWAANNKKHISNYTNEYGKTRKKKDVSFKLRTSISSSVCHALKTQNSKKKGSVLKHLPYTIDQLKEHLEKQFDEHMSWSNHGTYWHIDHIYPQSKLLYTSMEDDNFKKCWSLSNLRPLEKITNIKKGNKT